MLRDIKNIFDVIIAFLATIVAAVVQLFGGWWVTVAIAAGLWIGVIGNLVFEFVLRQPAPATLNFVIALVVVLLVGGVNLVIEVFEYGEWWEILLTLLVLAVIVLLVAGGTFILLRKKAKKK